MSVPHSLAVSQPAKLGHMTALRTGADAYWDECPSDPEPRAVGDDAESGRGLTVVAALSARWGWERTGYRHKRIWAELAL